MIKLISGLYGGVTAMIAAIFAIASRKATSVAAGLATLAALVVIFIACINALVLMLVGAIGAAEAMISTWLLVFIGMFVPANTALCLSSIVSAKICRAAYDLGRKKTDIVVYGS